MKFFKSRCYNGGKKHNFQSRKSETVTARGQQVSIHALILLPNEDRLKAVTDRKIIYTCDVCTWCGKVVNEQKGVE